MLKRPNILNTVRRELRGILNLKKSLTIAAIIGVIIIISGWIFFEGPCRLSLFFAIPGGGFTIVMYYILWIILFAVGGLEFILYLHIFRYSDTSRCFCHIATYLCMFLWYPLFFTLFSQFLALVVITAALVLNIINLRYITKISFVITAISVIRTVILLLFTYINLAFLIIN